MEEFQHDTRYLAWLQAHPSGFVLNAHRSPQARYMVLHAASCRAIQPGKHYRAGQFAEHAYLKVGATTIAELSTWSACHGRPDGSFSKVCGQCRPQVAGAPFADHRLEDEIDDAGWLTDEELKAKLPPAGHRPAQRIVERTEFVRSGYVIVAALRRANGICEKCGSKAPFLKQDGSPYLEVHHKVRLVDGGEDTLANAIAVCPNCHCEYHYGAAAAAGPGLG